MEFRFRAGRPEDIPGMYRLDLLCFDEPFRFDLETMAHFANEPGAIVIVAEQGAELAGFTIVNLQRRRKHAAGYVTTLDVHPDCRRQGLAQELMRRVEEQTFAAGFPEMRLHVFTGNEAAIGLYESLGFERVFPYEGFYGDGLDAWVYGKKLGSSES